MTLIVAPYAGAWIERRTLPIAEDTPWSLLTQERGLKASVVIESLIYNIGSLLTQERGLKAAQLKYAWMRIASLLTQERGLKEEIRRFTSIRVKSLLTQERGLKAI